jgi:Cof subfamily protein (haloacid dehalogenase superfamily)
MSEVKLIALDMDGTLFNSEGEVSEKDKEIIRKATETGVAVAVATGRSYAELPIEMLYDVGIRYAITGNGSAVYKIPTMECVFSDCMDTELVCRILGEVKELDIYYDVYIQGRAYRPEHVTHNIRRMDLPESLYEAVEQTRIVVPDLVEYLKETKGLVEKATLNFALLEDGTLLDRDKSEEILKRYPQVEYLSGGFHNWEFTKAGVNKGTGLKFLAERIGAAMDETMACGDSQNDLSMLKAAQVAVAMGNAKEEIKEMADFITLSNDESGVGYAIEKFVFGK